LDDWNFLSPQLQDLYDTLNQGRARYAFAFEPRLCMAPLPRAYQWVNGAGYGQHEAPLMQQGASDDFLGPCDDVVCTSEALGIDFEATLAVITGDVRRGASAGQALDGIRLVMLANAVTLRELVPAEQARGAGLLQSKPATAFSPVAVTLDELGSAWDQGRLQLTLQSTWNGRRVGLCEAGPEMTFHFGELIAHLCKTRNVRAGSVVGSGTVSNKDWRHGYSCIAEKRAIETIQDGAPATDYMKYGDTIRIEMKGRDGQSLFGAIDQRVVAPA
jgi:fumarylacetoacetate (FAA) hydrolase